jgi:plasmid stability protein
MANLSIRGLDEKALAELKKRAAKEDSSVNTLVLRLIEQGLGRRRAKAILRRHDDLDALAGSWRKSDAAAF